jgi:hypothetical protein
VCIHGAAAQVAMDVSNITTPHSGQKLSKIETTGPSETSVSTHNTTVP